MIKKPVTIQNNMDMEDRPIAHLVQEASQYASQVYIEIDNKKINAKSIMGMMTLGLPAGEEITVIADGNDETQAIEHIDKYLSNEN